MRGLGLVAAALLVYGLLGLGLGWSAVTGELRQLPGWIWLLAALVVSAGYALLFARWQVLLRTLGHPLHPRPSAAIFVAGLALIAAPARSGEALRGLWLQRRHGIPLHIGVAATAAERLLDLASALLVLAWGLGQGQARIAMLVVVLLGASLLWLLSHPAGFRHLELWLTRLSLGRRWRGLYRVLWEGLQAVGELRRVLRPAPLALGLALTTAVWLLESALLQRVLQDLGAAITLQQSMVIRTATSLGGVLSLLPAGLGTSELTSVGLAMLSGASRSQALAATVVLRAATLLLPSLVGMLSLAAQRDLRQLRRPRTDSGTGG